MRGRPIHDQYARLPWLIVAMTVVVLTIGALAAWHVEQDLVASALIRSKPWTLAAAWALAWLPMLVFSIWSAMRLRAGWSRAPETQAHATDTESKYRQLVEQASDIIYRVDLHGYFTYINSTVTRFKGYTQEELIGQHFTEHIRPDAREAARRFYLRQFARKTPSTYYEFPVIKKDGGEIWFGQNVQLLMEGDQVAGFQAVARDITERKQMEHLLLRSRDFYLNILQDFPALIWQSGTDGKCNYFNRTWLTFTGRTLEQEEGDGWAEGVHPDDLDRCLKTYLEAFQARRSFTMEYRLRRHDGEYRHILDHGTPFQNLDGRFAGFIGSCMDITERKRAELALRDSEMQMRLFLEATADCVWNWDMTTAYVARNSGFEKLFGYASEEVDPVVDWWAERVHPDDRERVLMTFQDAVASGRNTCEYDYRFRRRDGSYAVVSDRAFILRNDAGTVVRALGAMTDITERKQAEEALIASEKRLRAIIEAEPECVKVTTEDCVVLDMNAAGLAAIEADSLDQVIGQSVCPFVVSSYRDAYAEFNRRVFRGEPGTMQYEMIGLKGRRRWMDTHAIPLKDECDTTIGVLAITRDITERKQAEEALRRSERRLALVLEATNEGLWDWNIKTGGVYYSPQWIESLGFTPEEVPPHISFWESRLHPDDRPGIEEALRAHFSGQTETYQYENRLRLKSGEWRWNLDRGKVVEWDENGRPLRMVGTDTDITARKRSEEQLAKINACFLGFGVSPEQNITRLTALCGELLGAACALYNYLDGPLLRSVGQWNVPDDFKPVDPAEGHICLEVIRQGEDRPVTVRNLQATPYAQSDPNVLPYNLQTYFGMAVSCQGSAVGSLCAVFQRDFVPCEADARLLGIIAAAIGVEEERRLAEAHQKRLLEELAESRNRFEMFFRQTPSAISITTIKDGRFLDLNKQAELLTGYTRDELIGRTTVEMSLYVDPSERPGLVQELKRKGMLTDLEREIRTKSGEIRTAVFSLVPIHMGSEPCILSIAHDITARKQAEQRLHERSRQQAIEAELSLLAVTIQDLPNLLSTAAGLVLNALEVNYCEVLELIPNATDLRLCASAGWRGDEVGEVRALETGSPAHAALNANKPVVRTLLKESRFGGPQWLHEHGVVTGMSVSIPGKDGPWGVLGVYAAATRTFSRDDVNFLQTVSSILGTAIERMQTETVLRSANQSLRLLSRQLLQVQEDDRRAIARDLHDEIGQSLTAIKLNVERAQRTADRDARAHIMRDCAQITERVLAQVRNLSLDLHPSILDDLGLAFALKWYADRQAERAGLKVDVTADPSLPRLPQDVEIACFRIVQEALTNVVRHARANLAGVTLKRGAHALELCIQDDGIGFVVDMAVAPLNGRSSVGLASMQERAKLLGGTVKISSAPHCGTTVVATLPLPVTSPDHLPAEKTRQR